MKISLITACYNSANTIKTAIESVLEQKGVEILEANAMPDHIHMLVSIPPYISIAQFMG